VGNQNAENGVYKVTFIFLFSDQKKKKSGKEIPQNSSRNPNLGEGLSG
jgi:hypothetical protein